MKNLKKKTAKFITVALVAFAMAVSAPAAFAAGSSCQGSNILSGRVYFFTGLNGSAGTSSSGDMSFTELFNAMLAKFGVSIDRTQTGIPGGGNTAPAETPASSTDIVPMATPSEAETAAPAASVEPDRLSFELQVIQLVNEQRAAIGLSPLDLNTELGNVAEIKAQDMHDNDYFSHTSPTYGSFSDMFKAFGISYTSAGENIAMGYSSPEAVMKAWMNSSGHRANILNTGFTQIGVGYVADGNYWVQEFIG